MASIRPVATMAMCVAFILAGCSGSSGSTAAEKDVTSTVPSATTTLARATPKSDSSGSRGAHRVPETQQSRALAEKLLPTILGYAPQPDPFGELGPMDLVKAIDDAPGAAERKMLTADSFVVGYQRLFVTPAKERLVTVTIYQFTDAAGANDYLSASVERVLRHLRSNVEDWTSSASHLVSGIPGGFGFEGDSDNAQFHDVVFAKGNYWVMIRTNYSKTIRTKRGVARKGHPTAVELATEQYARL